MPPVPLLCVDPFNPGVFWARTAECLCWLALLGPIERSPERGPGGVDSASGCLAGTCQPSLACFCSAALFPGFLAAVFLCVMGFALVAPFSTLLAALPASDVALVERRLPFVAVSPASAPEPADVVADFGSAPPGVAFSRDARSEVLLDAVSRVLAVRCLAAFGVGLLQQSL